MSQKSINPFNGEILNTYEEFSEDKVDFIIAEANKAFKDWRSNSFKERSVILSKTAKILRDEKEHYGKVLTMEMGKTLSQAIAEVEKCAWVCEYYAENTEEILKTEVIPTDADKSYVRFDPLGVILAVMPWNFPFWQVFRFAAPALMAGNVCLLKHASNVPQSALAIEEIFTKAGLPKYLFNTLLISSSAVERVLKNDLVKAATLTGSEFAGSKVAGLCGTNIKKTVLELGGSDPFIVLADADIEKAVSSAVTARIINNGQSCISAKRFIVEEKIYDIFSEKFIEQMRNLIVGNPMDSKTQVGPIAREDLLFELLEQIKKSKEMGAVIETGGRRIDLPGFFLEPTVITNIKKGMPAYDQELFGPVASLFKVKDEDEAIETANDSLFGLGASLWTSNIKKAEILAQRIESGSVFINGMVKSDPRLPFGGIKLSGYGRELSHYGIKEFVNIKTVWIKE